MSEVVEDENYHVHMGCRKPTSCIMYYSIGPRPTAPHNLVELDRVRPDPELSGHYWTDCRHGEKGA